MLRAFLLLLISLSAGWFIADAIKQNGPGYVLVYYQHYSIETSVWIGLLLVFLLVLLSYLLIKCATYLWQLFTTARSFNQHKQHKAQHQIIQALANEDWQTVYQLANKKIASNDLLAARAAFNAGDLLNARACLKIVSQDITCDKLSLMLLHFDIANQSGEDNEAKALLAQLLNQFAGNLSVFERAANFYLQHQDWPALEALFDELLKKQKGLNQTRQTKLLAQVGRALLSRARQIKDEKSLEKIWLVLNKSPARNALLADYCQGLLVFHHQEKAKKLITTRLKHQFDESCMLCYAQLDMDKTQQLEYLQTQEKIYPFSSQIALALALVFLHQQQWEKAYQSIEQSITLCASADAYRVLSLYYEKRNDERRAKESLLKALELAPR